MADTQEAPFSLMSLEDELTCSICLSTFDCPVTIPCGHNFCQDCLLATWKDSYSCPQCRTHFASRPELKKNTVLSSVVETLRSSRSEEPKDVIRCDTCMEAEAAQTCLTCMASFCEEHLRPHRENPNFRVHQLSEPVGDLLERICPDHNKLMELFCSQHNRPICSLCLQVHKGCSFMTPEEQRSLKESELRDKLGCLDSKIEKTEAVMYQMKETQSKLKEGASKRKAVIAALYQHMRDILTQEERTAHVEVDCELELCHNKLRELTKRFTDNAETMRKAREDINSLLSQSQATAFLQASYDLPKVVKFDPYIPRVNLDSKKVTAIQAFANALNEHLTEMLTQPVEDRLPTMSPRPELKADTAAAGEKVAPVSEPASSNRSGPQPEPERSDSPAQSVRPASHIPAPPPIQPYFQPVPVPVFSYMSPQAGWNPPRPGRGASAGFSRPPPFRPAKPQRSEGQTTEKTVSKPVEQRQQGKTGGKPKTAVKQSDASRQTHHKQSPAPGENKPSGSHFTKKDKPKSHNPGQAKGPHPGNKKK